MRQQEKRGHNKTDVKNKTDKGGDRILLGRLIEWNNPVKNGEPEPFPTKEAVDGFQLLLQTEGIFAALESSHAIAYVKKCAPQLPRHKVIIVCLSGRGDKDLGIIKKHVTVR